MSKLAPTVLPNSVDIRRKTYSEMSSFKGNDGLSAHSTSPFFLSSPLTSSIVLERHHVLPSDGHGVIIDRGTPKQRPKHSKIQTHSSRKIEKAPSSSFFPGPTPESSPELEPKANLNVKARAERQI